MGRRTTQSTSLTDFTGGLNLRANPFQLAPNESPDMLNVDIDPRGGIMRRGGVGLHSQVPSPSGFTGPHRLFVHGDKVIAQTNNQFFFLVSRSGSQWHPLRGGAGLKTPFAAEAASLGLRTYFATGPGWGMVFNGSNLTSVPPPGEGGRGWNESLDEPGGSGEARLVRARVYAPFTGGTGSHLFAGNTYEGDAQRRHRVRWSWPSLANETVGPNRWRSLDYLDINCGRTQDQITAMVQFRDHIVVFKRHSVWALYADNPTDAVYVKQIADGIGTTENKNTISTEMGVFFYDSQEGLFLYNGEGIQWLFEPLKPLIDDGLINADRANLAVLGYADRKLHLSLPNGSDHWNSVTYVLDVDLMAWTRYNYGMHNYANIDQGGRRKLLGVRALDVKRQTLNARRYVYVVNADLSWDLWSGPNTQHLIRAHYQTSWVGDPSGADTQFRRAEYMAIAGNAGGSGASTVRVDVDAVRDFGSYSPDTPVASTAVPPPQPPPAPTVSWPLISGISTGFEPPTGGPAPGETLWVDATGFDPGTGQGGTVYFWDGAQWTTPPVVRAAGPPTAQTQADDGDLYFDTDTIVSFPNLAIYGPRVTTTPPPAPPPTSPPPSTTGAPRPPTRRHSFNMPTNGQSNIYKGDLLGKSRSMSLRFSVPATRHKWQITAALVKYWRNKVGP